MWSRNCALEAVERWTYVVVTGRAGLISWAVAAGLMGDVCVMPSEGELPGNLPVQHSSFVGRAREVADVGGVVGRGADRDVDRRRWRRQDTSGDSRWRQRCRCRGSTMVRGWSSWPAVRDPKVVVDAVAAVFGVARRPRVDLVETLAGFLRPKELLLVLDNCEHLLGPVVELVRALEGRVPEAGGAGDEPRRVGYRRRTHRRRGVARSPNFG